MTTLAVTRLGWGDVLSFEDYEDAFFHPVVQFGDVVVADVEDLWVSYTRYEWRKLMKFAGVRDDQASEALDFLNDYDANKLRRDMAPRIWEALLQKSRPAPRDLAGILAMVAEDRQVERRDYMARKSKEEKEVAKQAAEREMLMDNDRIVFGTNRKGEALSSKNSPHREGTASFERWKLYRNNMTVKQALAAGLTRPNIRGSRIAGHIQIVRAA